MKKAQREGGERTHVQIILLCDYQCVGNLYHQATLLHTTAPKSSTYLKVECKAVIVNKDGLRFPA